MKEIPGTKKIKLDSFPKKLKIKEKEMTKPYEIANELSKSFTGIGSNLACSIANTTKNCKGYLIPSENDLEFHELTIEEFETVFKSLKSCWR